MKEVTTMGTRHLTVVIKDNEIKLSQYGQWDGYFTYSGTKFLEFVKENLQSKSKKKQKYCIETFGEKIDTLKKVDEKTYQEFIAIKDRYGFDNTQNKSQFAIPFDIMFPQFSRDTGVRILDIINRIQAYMFNPNYKFPVILEFDGVGYTEFVNVINLDTEEIYMLTTHEFKGVPLPTCELVENVYKHHDCWYKSSIRDIPSIAKIKKYKESIGLGYWQRDNGEWVSN